MAQQIPPQQNSILSKQLMWLFFFSVAMGFLEASVVVYLRLIFYPHGFEFPLVALDAQIGLVEILRETATILMLISVAVLAGKTSLQRLAHFCMAFAIWDIFYYVFLKLILDWPLSLFTWDILFLIPVPWIGPVISPILVSLTMVAFAFVMLKNDQEQLKMNRMEWTLVILGSTVIVISWTWDYIRFGGSIVDSPHKALTVFSSYVPSQFNWWLFGAGEAIVLTIIFLSIKKIRVSHLKTKP